MFLRRPKAVRASARRQLRTDALDAVSIACIDVWTFATFLVFFVQLRFYSLSLVSIILIIKTNVPKAYFTQIIRVLRRCEFFYHDTMYSFNLCFENII